MNRRLTALSALVLRVVLVGVGVLALTANDSACNAEGPKQTDGKTATENVELRAAWINPGAINEATLAKLQRANLNTVFLRAPKILPQDGGGSGTPARFGEFLGQAQERGLAVHGWILNHRRTTDVRFDDPVEQAAQARWAVKLLEMFPSLDGVHLDYIRYKEWAHSDHRTEAVTKTVGLIRKAINARHRGKFLTAAVFAAARAAYRGEQGEEGVEWTGAVPEWYRTWYAANPDNYYAREVRENPKLRKDKVCGPNFLSYQQDPPTWLRRGIVDAVLPMSYTSDRKRWNTEVDLWKGFLGNRFNRLYPGLGWLREAGHDDWALDPAALCAHIAYGRQAGVKGFSIFGLGQSPDDTPLIEALTVDGDVNKHNAPFKKPAVSPLKSKQPWPHRSSGP